MSLRSDIFAEILSGVLIRNLEAESSNQAAIRSIQEKRAKNVSPGFYQEPITLDREKLEELRLKESLDDSEVVLWTELEDLEIKIAKQKDKSDFELAILCGIPEVAA